MIEQLKEELQKVATSYNNVSIDHPMALTAAALRCHDFTVDAIGYGGTAVKADELWKREESCGPYVHIESPSANALRQKIWQSEASSKKDAYFVELTFANLRMQARLLDVLGEFYQHRNVASGLRLTLDSMAAGSCLLQSQASQVVGLPENAPGRKAWVEEARMEMVAFTEFLVGRLG